ncbi:MAG: SDR family oxidoreductase [Gammaproteobacteria bacterium]|nr:MAG: SDR family oxidoreductase [Gammaproteobacteria bacterium]
MILLTGATGKTGGAAADALIEMGVPFRALVRDAEKAAALKEAGVDLIVGDAADPEAVRKAMEGVDRVALILPNSQEQEALEMQFVDIATAAGVKHLVKLSSLEALPEATSPIPALHWRVEEHIRASGLDWTMIRPNFFMDNLLGYGFSIKNEGSFALPMGDGVTVMMDCKDIGLAIATVLAGAGHAGRSYNLSGPELLSFHDVASQFGEVLGKPIEYLNVDPTAYREIIAPFLTSDWHADAVMHLFSEVVDGVVPPKVTTTFKELTGQDPTSFRQFVQNHIELYG